MYLDNGSKPWKVLDGKMDPGMAMAHAHLDTGAGKLVVTDGRMMAIYKPRIVEGDTDGPVSGEALQAASKSCAIVCNGSLDVLNGPTYARPECHNAYPQWQMVEQREDGDVVKLNLDVALLWKLAQAMGGTSKSAVLSIEVPVSGLGAIHAHPLGDPETHGIIMPFGKAR